MSIKSDTAAARGCLEDEKLEGMALESIRMLDSLPDKSVKARAKRVAKRFLKRGNASDTDPIFWPAGFLMFGLMSYAETAAGQETADRSVAAVRSRLDDWYAKGGKVRYADDAIAGCAMLACHRLTGESRYMDMADRIYDHIVNETQKNAEGSVIYHPSSVNSCIYADGTGMIVMFLSEYAKAGGKNAEYALRLAGCELENFLKHGIDTLTGLPYHGYLLNDDGTQEKKGLVGWGRAVGFLLMGMNNYCGIAEDQAIRAASEAITHAALNSMRKDGCFPWLLTAADGHVDTAATAMIGWALINAEDRPHDSEVLRLTAGLKKYLREGAMTEALAECVDFGEHPQRYGCYPWGQGAALAFFSRL